MSETNLITRIIQKAVQQNKTIVLPESHDERVIQAAAIIKELGIANVITIGSDEKIRETAKKINIDISGVQIINPEKSELTSNFADLYYNLRKHKGITLEKARDVVKGDLFFAAMLVKEGMADGSVAGSIAPTGDVLRAAFQCIGMPEGISIVSSFFLMLFPERNFSFADCAVVPNPDAVQLADIAISTADNHKRLTGEEPYVAMLSFSTKGSAKHELVDKVLDATAIAKLKRPDLNMDGELQLDAAIIDSIGKRKAPESDITGRANGLVFPDLNAGNIGYKIAQRLGGAEAVGPIIQGLKKPLFDLSRGCIVKDIVSTCAIAVIMTE